MQRSPTPSNRPQHSPHVWGDPVAGAGPSKICKKCGAKRTVVGDDSECEGKATAAVAETIHDYDPI